ncbi:MAG: methylisocitrate lyase [Alphaproteobacteria bacterium]
METAGQKFRKALIAEKPLQIMGTINAYSALLAKQAGYKAIYLSGAGVANASYGIPDLGITSLNDVLIDAERITSAVDIPLLVDIDTGWGGSFNVARTIKSMEKAGVAAVHMEDQVGQKRCGHRPNKALVSTQEMVDRIKSAVDGRTQSDFVIMARTDAYGSEGLEAAINRAKAYIEAGADMIFAEAMHSLDDYQQFTKSISVPLLANITEFGKTPLFSVDELEKVGAAMVLYPLSAFRAMSKVTSMIYNEIRQKGTQQYLLDQMQTRNELYEVLNYLEYEEKLDNLFKKNNITGGSNDE